MNDLLPRPWDAIAYGLVLGISLCSFVAVVFVISLHCEWVYPATGIKGACVPGSGLFLIELAFLTIAAYAAWQFCGILREMRGP